MDNSLSALLLLPYILAVPGLFAARRSVAKFGSPELTHPQVRLFFAPALIILLTLFLPKLLTIFGETDSAPEKIAALLINSLIMSFVFALVIFFFAWRAGGIITLGFRATKLAHLARAWGSYGCFIPGYLVSAQLWILCLHQFVQKGVLEHLPQHQAILETILNVEPWVFVLMFFAIVLVTPFFEELLFRAFLQPGLQAVFGKNIALFASAAIFALAHEAIAVLPIFFLGLLLGDLYRRSGRIWVPFAVHAMHNVLVLSIWIVFPSVRESFGG